MELLIAIVSFVASWYLTHRYYVKSLANQATEAKNELAIILSALSEARPTDSALLEQKFIEGAVEAWKEKGTAVHYLNSLSGLTQEQKSDIFLAAALRHKGREPKHNPYAA